MNLADAPIWSLALRRRPHDLNASAIDLLICAVSAGYGAPIYTTDADFRRYAAVLRLKLHAPRTKPKGSE